MTVEELLRAQHEELKAHFGHARSLGSAAARLRARDDLARLLRAHTSLEEEELYPKLEALEETAELADASFRAHEQMREVLEELDGCSPDDTEYDGILDELQELVEDHVEHQEERLLEWVADEWPAERRESLGADMAARYEELRTSGDCPVVAIDRDQLPEA